VPQILFTKYNSLIAELDTGAALFVDMPKSAKIRLTVHIHIHAIGVVALL